MVKRMSLVLRPVSRSRLAMSAVFLLSRLVHYRGRDDVLRELSLAGVLEAPGRTRRLACRPGKAGGDGCGWRP
jgi:hypothetical protein